MQGCNNIKGDLILYDTIASIETNGIYSCSGIKSIVFNTTSSLHTLGVRSLQLLSNLNKIVLPPSLLYISSETFKDCGRLWEIQFLGDSAPIFLDVSGTGENRNITSAFGTSNDNYTGNINPTVNDSPYYEIGRIVYVKTNATGFDTEDWNNSIFSLERNKFSLSKTL
jgi:hypothetical protein